MNSAQRRTQKRKWLRENAEEIERVIAWLNGPELFDCIPDHSEKDCYELRLALLKAFGEKYPRSRADWKSYLLDRGVDASRFKPYSEDEPMALIGSSLVGLTD